MDIIEKLNWRYATKQFDPTKKLSDDQVNKLIEATNLSPSSFGLQPFSILLIENEEIRKKLKEAAWNQPQLTDASHVVLFAAHTDLSNKDVEDFLKLISETRNIPLESLSEYDAMMKGFIAGMSESDKINWISKQTYIALGQLLVTCAVEGIDACPMEGFDKGQFDEILGLKDKNLTSVVMATIGYRSENDKYQHLAKVRKPIDQILVRI